MQTELWQPPKPRYKRLKGHGVVLVGSGEYRAPLEEYRICEPDADTLQYEVLTYLRECRGYGSTDMQGQSALNLPGNTYRPRRQELEQLGLVVRTTDRRLTDSGRAAIVFKAVEYGVQYGD